MKLKSCFLVTLMVCAMFSCSNDDVPEVKTITAGIPDATLELAVQTKSKGGLRATKGDNDAVDRSTWDYAVKNMTVAIFNAGAYTENGVSENKLVAVFSKGFDTVADSYQVSGMGLQSGPVHVLVLANLSAANQQKLLASVASSNDADRMTYDEVLALPVSLDNENATNGLTMKSGVLTNLTLAAGNNCIGFTEATKPEGYTEIYKKEIKLTRLIAAIHLNSLSVINKPENNCQDIVVNKIYLANVKGEALISGEKELEAEDGAYWAGAYTEEVGPYKLYKATSKKYLCQEIAVSDVDGKTPIEPGGDWIGAANTFFVYPNIMGGEGCNTLLIVEATYNYNDGSAPQTRFYRVPVNHKDFGGSSPYLVSSNYKYLIDLKVGIGSPIPYDDPQDAHISAKVTVAAWDVININQPVD